MQIVITDGYTLNPGDLNWDTLHQLGEVKYYDRTSPQEMIQRCKEAHVIVTNKTPVTAETIKACPHLKLVAVTATGYNIVDVEAAGKVGVPVCNVPIYGTHSVAQHTFALILELTNRVGQNSQRVSKGDWSAAKDWCFTSGPLIELLDKTIGIVGLGRIGEQVARMAEAFGMKVIYHNRSPKQVGWKSRTVGELFKESDFISVHCPLTSENEKFINEQLIATMKPKAFLINTSRGQLIDEEALANALQKGVIAGAALDVLSKEPPPKGHPLVGLKNCLITPHNAWLSFEARKRMMATTVENIQAALKGNPIHVVNQGYLKS
ncbi:MAG: D-2-hydroxyacid dehydrogenase [Imperialibacter sp.]|uniref:D-2-hydroxyacid dehydrogenase n=1 Tax=Imperialibacter sp. TaxID=2038411 RepID=UPI003A861711